jgi:hypothetical protein
MFGAGYQRMSMPKLLKALRATEAPFLLGGLMAFAAWAGTHIVDRTLESPVIEYSYRWVEKPSFALIPCDSESVAPKYYLEVLTRNLSRDSLFKGVEIAFRMPSETKARIVGHHIRTVPPAMPNPENVGRCGAKYARFPSLTFQPRTEFHLLLGVSAKELPVAHLINADGAVYFRESDIETYLVRNEVIFIMIALFFVLGLAVLYLLLLER